MKFAISSQLLVILSLSKTAFWQVSGCYICGTEDVAMMSPNKVFPGTDLSCSEIETGFTEEGLDSCTVFNNPSNGVRISLSSLCGCEGVVVPNEPECVICEGSSVKPGRMVDGVSCADLAEISKHTIDGDTCFFGATNRESIEKEKRRIENRCCVGGYSSASTITGLSVATGMALLSLSMF
eukprot:scaffold9951_cov146-Cylindrotheca_fusiformis.AAC.8